MGLMSDLHILKYSRELRSFVVERHPIRIRIKKVSSQPPRSLAIFEEVRLRK